MYKLAINGLIDPYYSKVSLKKTSASEVLRKIQLNENEPSFLKEDKEVDEIIEVAVSELLNKESVLDTFTTSNNTKIKAQCYLLQNKKVWGATATILAELKALLS